MVHIKLDSEDRHFEHNLRLAGDWGEDNAFEIQFRRIASDDVVERQAYRVQVRKYAADHSALYVKWKEGDRMHDKIGFPRLVQVAWRPDIRRYFR